MFPVQRMRRLRKTASIRKMVREVQLSVDDFVYPFFIVPGEKVNSPIPSMPGVAHLSTDVLKEEARAVADLGIPAVLLFGLPETKDAVGSGAYAGDGIVQRGIRAIKEAVPDLLVITDVCMCEYTDHGHCGVISDGDVDNDASLELIAETALSHVKAGADMVAPSDMMDGRVWAIRSLLDRNGYLDVPIMSYSAKYASSFYGPFREAADSAPQFGDRRSYQMDPPNVREAMREIALDIEEGADIVMVKPALPYLDIIRLTRDSFDLPVAAYQVSGEYAMIKAAAEKNWVDGEKVMMESLISIKRAGADIIITYFAKEAAALLG